MISVSRTWAPGTVPAIGGLSGVAEVGERYLLGVEGGQHDQFGGRGVADEVVLEAGVGEQGDRVHRGGERAPGRVR